MKVQPRPLVGILVFLAYLVVFYGIWIVNGIDYETIGDSADNLLKWYVAPLAGGAVVLIIAATMLGWWRPAILEVRKAPRWTVIPAVLMLLLGVFALTQKDYSDKTSTMFLWLIVGSIGVGFCEELATRGLLLVGLRGTLSERKVWLFSSLLFGLMHLPNWVFGAGPGATFQVLLAFLSGTTLYLLRRGAGTLLICMLLHAFWDFTAFVDDGAAYLGFINAAVGIAAVILALRLTRLDRDEPTLAPYAVVPQHAAA